MPLLMRRQLQLRRLLRLLRLLLRRLLVRRRPLASTGQSTRSLHRPPVAVTIYMHYCAA